MYICQYFVMRYFKSILFFFLVSSLCCKNDSKEALYSSPTKNNTNDVPSIAEDISNSLHNFTCDELIQFMYDRGM